MPDERVEQNREPPRGRLHADLLGVDEDRLWESEAGEICIQPDQSRQSKRLAITG